MAYQLPADKYAQLLDAERRLTDMTALLPKAEECGVDCQQARAKVQTQLNIIANLKKNFAPTSLQHE